MSDSTWDKHAAVLAEHHLTAIVDLLIQMDQRIAATVAREFAANLISLVADIGAMNPNPKVASGALENILDLQIETEGLKQGLLEAAHRD